MVCCLSQNYDESVPLLVIFHDPYVYSFLYTREMQLTMYTVPNSWASRTL